MHAETKACGYLKKNLFSWGFPGGASGKEPAC